MCHITKEELRPEVVVQEDPMAEEEESDTESEAPSEPILNWTNNGPLDLFTLLDIHQLLDGYDVSINKLVCKKWDWYMGAGINRLPRKVLSSLDIVRRKVRYEGGLRNPIEVQITGKKERELFDVSFTAADQDALWRELENRIPNSYIEHFYISSLIPTHFLLGSIATASGNIAVGTMTLDGVSFSGLMNYEFRSFIFGFKQISALDLEKAVVLPEQLDNVFLARAALKGVSKLRLPRAYPLGSNHYNFDCTGVTTFLRNAPADQGVIELSAFYADFTLDPAMVIPRLREVLKRPHAAMKVYVYKHRLDSEYRQMLQQADGHDGPPPEKRSKYARALRLQVECEPSSLRASTQTLNI